MNWKFFLFLFCLIAWSDGRAQGQVYFGESAYFEANQRLERDWTIMVGTRRIGFLQYAHARDLKGGKVLWVDSRSPQNYQWLRYTTVHLGFTDFTTRGPAWLIATLVNAVPLIVAIVLVLWKRTRPNHALQRTRPSRPGCNRSAPRAGSLSLGR